MKMSREAFELLENHLPEFLQRERSTTLKPSQVRWEAFNDMLNAGRITFAQIDPEAHLTEAQIETALKKVQRRMT